MSSFRTSHTYILRKEWLGTQEELVMALRADGRKQAQHRSSKQRRDHSTNGGAFDDGYDS